MKFVTVYKYEPEVKEHLSKFVGKTYYKGIKLVDLAEVDLTFHPSGDVKPAYVAMCKASILRYLLYKREVGKYATTKIGWKL